MRAPELKISLSTLSDWVAASFRAKLLLLASVSVVFALVLSSTVALNNLTTLGDNSTQRIQQGLTDANNEYLSNYITTTSQRINIMLNSGFSELAMLADVAQSLIDQPADGQALGRAMASQPGFDKQFAQPDGAKWLQNKPGAPTVVSVWGPLVGSNKQPKPDVLQHIAGTAVLDHVLPAVKNNGANKLYAYLVGPHDQSYLRLAPYLDMAAEFDKAYPGSTNADFWDFFFPGFVKDWQAIADSGMPRDKLSHAFSVTAPYEDAAGGGLIISVFHPLWINNYKTFGGAVAVDTSIGQMVQLIESVKLAQTGFAFLSQPEGNVLAISKEGEKLLALQSSVSGKSTSNLDRYLSKSTQPDVAALTLPTDDNVHFKRIQLKRDGVDIPCIVVTKRLQAMPLWAEGKGIQQKYWSLGFVVPESEILAPLHEAQRQLRSTMRNTLYSQILVGCVSLIVIFLVVWWFSRRMTKGLIDLTKAASQLSSKQYGSQVRVQSKDEIGQLGTVFNEMSAEIQRYTTRLEDLVEARTNELARANQEVIELNRRLKAENLRMGAELDVARKLQMMVLPKERELQGIPELEISGYMRPADEIGGDYYDVLYERDLVKIGIGDVTGHGLESGVVMLMVQSIVRTLLDSGNYHPARFLQIINGVLHKNVNRIDTDKNLSLAFLDYQHGVFTLSGQHEEVIIVRVDGTMERIDTVDLGFPVAMEPDIQDFVSTREIVLDEGDTLVLFTDGVTEADDMQKVQYGIERLCDSAVKHHHLSAHAMCAKIVSDLEQHIGQQTVYDDITVLVVRQLPKRQ